MDLITARILAENLMEQHGLIALGWRFEFDRAPSRLGRCYYDSKRITVSKYFTSAATQEQFEQTMLHEIAHALLPADVGHRALWKLKARSIGYTGKRTAFNPYQEQQRKAKAAFTTRQVAGSDNPVVPKVLVASLSASQGEPKRGDILLLPTKVELRVEEVDTRHTKAVEVGTGQVWTLSTPDAYRFIKH